MSPTQLLTLSSPSSPSSLSPTSLQNHPHQHCHALLPNLSLAAFPRFYFDSPTSSSSSPLAKKRKMTMMNTATAVPIPNLGFEFQPTTTIASPSASLSNGFTPATRSNGWSDLPIPDETLLEILELNLADELREKGSDAILDLSHRLPLLNHRWRRVCQSALLSSLTIQDSWNGQSVHRFSNFLFSDPERATRVHHLTYQHNYVGYEPENVPEDRSRIFESLTRLQSLAYVLVMGPNLRQPPVPKPSSTTLRALSLSSTCGTTSSYKPELLDFAPWVLKLDNLRELSLVGLTLSANAIAIGGNDSDFEHLDSEPSTRSNSGVNTPRRDFLTVPFIQHSSSSAYLSNSSSSSSLFTMNRPSSPLSLSDLDLEPELLQLRSINVDHCAFDVHFCEWMFGKSHKVRKIETSSERDYKNFVAIFMESLEVLKTEPESVPIPVVAMEEEEEGGQPQFPGENWNNLKSLTIRSHPQDILPSLPNLEFLISSASSLPQFETAIFSLRHLTCYPSLTPAALETISSSARSLKSLSTFCLNPEHDIINFVSIFKENLTSLKVNYANKVDEVMMAVESCKGLKYLHLVGSESPNEGEYARLPQGLKYLTVEARKSRWQMGAPRWDSWYEIMINTFLQSSTLTNNNDTVFPSLTHLRMGSKDSSFCPRPSHIQEMHSACSAHRQGARFLANVDDLFDGTSRLGEKVYGLGSESGRGSSSEEDFVREAMHLTGEEWIGF